MSIGAFVPADNGTPVAETILGGAHLSIAQVRSRLGANEIRRYEMPPVYGAIVVRDDAKRSGAAINARASSILWKAAPALSPWLILYGDALVLGYDPATEDLCSLTPQMQDIVDHVLQERRRLGARRT